LRDLDTVSPKTRGNENERQEDTLGARSEKVAVGFSDGLEVMFHMSAEWNQWHGRHWAREGLCPMGPCGIRRMKQFHQKGSAANHRCCRVMMAMQVFKGKEGHPYAPDFLPRICIPDRCNLADARVKVNEEHEYLATMDMDSHRSVTIDGGVT
jgi:hypothetical protein